VTEFRLITYEKINYRIYVIQIQNNIYTGIKLKCSYDVIEPKKKESARPDNVYICECIAMCSIKNKTKVSLSLSLSLFRSRTIDEHYLFHRNSFSFERFVRTV